MTTVNGQCGRCEICCVQGGASLGTDPIKNEGQEGCNSKVSVHNVDCVIYLDGDSVMHCELCFNPKWGSIRSYLCDDNDNIDEYC